jgi:L-aspartate oxidase
VGGASLSFMRVVDFVVVGAGIAGLRAALGLAEAVGEKGRVLVVTKEAMAESNTAYAQGGIAVAMGGPRDVALHLEDTLVAGDGLVDREAAEVLVREGPQRVEELLQWGTAFDRYGKGEHLGELMRTREGAHSLPRILHADGDATGRVIALSLLEKVKGTPQIELLEWATTVDLLVREGRVTGVSLLTKDGELEEVYARAVLLASGGAGQVYSDTTNPAVATGDGIAMAWRAGAELMDMEFYQFHPTALALEGAPRFLLSEALRGEGAWLVNAKGERFMERYDARLELAPRDVVARAIAREMLGGTVYLDMRAVGREMDLPARFPGISRFLDGYGLRLATDLIPVGPAAHYLMGGVRTDVHGRTTVAGLYAAGETACTGVHGANRLASNSLLEGLVFGAKAVEAMVDEQLPAFRVRGPGSGQPETRVESVAGPAAGVRKEVEEWIARLRREMWLNAGLLRDARGLEKASAVLASLAESMPEGLTRRELEARNLHTVAQVMVRMAKAREESRGAHSRLDFHQKKTMAQHSIVRLGEEAVRFVPDAGVGPAAVGAGTDAVAAR